MQHLSRPPLPVIEYSEKFENFLGTFTYPIALVSPALFDIMGSRANADELASAFVSLGFRELWTISFNKYGFIDNLAREAARNDEGAALFSACPFARRLIAEEYPAIFAKMTAEMPPADRTAHAARGRHRDATLFWVSPCSERASALLKRDGFDSNGAPYVDYLVPLATVFPAILDRLGIDPDSFQTDSCARAEEPCKDACATGLVDVVATVPEMRARLDAIASGASPIAPDGKPIVEFILCPNGCSDGDWAPCLARAAKADEIPVEANAATV
jgi:hypothetical protein